MILKKLTTLFSSQTKEVDAVQLWTVYIHYTARSGRFSSDVYDEMEAFTSEEAANEFADALRAALKLIRHTSGNIVTVKKVK